MGLDLPELLEDINKDLIDVYKTFRVHNDILKELTGWVETLEQRMKVVEEKIGVLTKKVDALVRDNTAGRRMYDIDDGVIFGEQE